MLQKIFDKINDEALFELIKNNNQIGSSNQNILKVTIIETPLGDMLAIADEKVLYLLEFLDRKNLSSELIQLQEKMQSQLVLGSSCPLELIRQEIGLYFKGELSIFKTPIKIIGPSFKIGVLKELLKIPFGKAYSYSDIAKLIDMPKAYRAVAKANSSNQLAIIIPCHRVINIDKTLGGYSAGVKKKKWLLDHELKVTRKLKAVL
jgi:AraC family transcriptional regulator, regulatory protein of adaptative response / methylated-DNA-[protein]-cysteine methyltransferase